MDLRTELEDARNKLPDHLKDALGNWVEKTFEKQGNPTPELA
jgi:hypothetical protein